MSERLRKEFRTSITNRGSDHWFRLPDHKAEALLAFLFMVGADNREGYYGPRNYPYCMVFGNDDMAVLTWNLREDWEVSFVALERVLEKTGITEDQLVEFVRTQAEVSL